jgi:hypothetical protein
MVASGGLPAVSPDGTKLAYVAPAGGEFSPYGSGCLTAPPRGSKFTVVVRTLATRAEQAYPAPGSEPQLPYPVSHLSWAPDGGSLLVTVTPREGNEAWGLATLNLASSYLPSFWLPGSGSIPITGRPDAALSYYEEGVHLPDGNLFVDRMCCRGVPVHTTSSLLQEITPSGQLVTQVGMGFLDRKHSSLDAYPGGKWLLYLSAHDLFLYGGGKPFKLTTGLIAAGWVPGS